LICTCPTPHHPTLGKPYNVRSLPRAFLIDRKGGTVKICKRFRNGDEARLKKEIEALLN
jgi:hypothetical protein